MRNYHNYENTKNNWAFWAFLHSSVCNWTFSESLRFLSILCLETWFARLLGAPWLLNVWDFRRGSCTQPVNVGVWGSRGWSRWSHEIQRYPLNSIDIFWKLFIPQWFRIVDLDCQYDADVLAKTFSFKEIDLCFPKLGVHLCFCCFFCCLCFLLLLLLLSARSRNGDIGSANTSPMMQTKNKKEKKRRKTGKRRRSRKAIRKKTGRRAGRRIL